MVLLDQQRNKLIFNVNESLLFESGQEIAEMVSISLDPDIVVQSYEEYIQIRGIILLQGEFIREKSNEKDVQPNIYDSALRYVEKVMENDDNRAYFSHRFPVEISVPLYRVNNIKDITATIDAFDYDIPTRNKLNIIASLHIYGINHEAAIMNQKLEHEEKTDVTNRSLPKGNKERELETIENQLESNIEQPNKDKKIDAKVNEERVAKQLQKESETPVEEQIVQATTGMEPFIQPPQKENRPEDDLVRDEYDEQIDETENSIDISMNESKENETDHDGVEDVTFLTDLFQRDEESQTRMKIYIAQEDDTIESIAKRYEVPILQLVKDNDLSVETLQGGQLIKIVKD